MIRTVVRLISASWLSVISLEVNPKMKRASLTMYTDHFKMKIQPGLTDAAYYLKLKEIFTI